MAYIRIFGMGLKSNLEFYRVVKIISGFQHMLKKNNLIISTSIFDIETMSDQLYQMYKKLHQLSEDQPNMVIL